MTGGAAVSLYRVTLESQQDGRRQYCYHCRQGYYRQGCCHQGRPARLDPHRLGHRPDRLVVLYHAEWLKCILLPQVEFGVLGLGCGKYQCCEWVRCRLVRVN